MSAPNQAPEDGAAEPSPGRYERYRFEQTPDGDALIYERDCEGCWLQAPDSLALEDWR